MAETLQADAITTALVQHRLFAIVEEMGEAMLRTAYSQILNSLARFLLAPSGRRAAPARRPGRARAGACRPRFPGRRVRWRRPSRGDIHPGDVFLLNDPYHGWYYLPDVTAFVPVFHDGALVFWSINRAHQSDIGGATHGAYNPGATEIWQEGIRIPPLKLADRGVERARHRAGCSPPMCATAAIFAAILPRWSARRVSPERRLTALLARARRGALPRRGRRRARRHRAAHPRGRRGLAATALRRAMRRSTTTGMAARTS